MFACLSFAAEVQYRQLKRSHPKHLHDPCRCAAHHRFDVAQAIVDCKPAQRARLDALLSQPVKEAIEVALKIKHRTAARRRQLKRAAHLLDTEHTAAEVQMIQVRANSDRRYLCLRRLLRLPAHRSNEWACPADRRGPRARRLGRAAERGACCGMARDDSARRRRR